MTQRQHHAKQDTSNDVKSIKRKTNEMKDRLAVFRREDGVLRRSAPPLTHHFHLLLLLFFLLLLLLLLLGLGCNGENGGGYLAHRGGERSEKRESIEMKFPSCKTILQTLKAMLKTSVKNVRNLSTTKYPPLNLFIITYLKCI